MTVMETVKMELMSNGMIAIHQMIHPMIVRNGMMRLVKVKKSIGLIVTMVLKYG